MPTIDFDQVRTQVTEFVQRVIAGDQLDVMIVGSLLVVVLLLSIAAILRGRRRAAAEVAVQLATPSNGSGFRRWLTPMGMKSIPAEQAVVVRPRRKSGSNKTIKVSTPVSKVATRALRATNADALDIARRTGLARDAVVMMMANADPKAHARRAAAAKAATAPKAPARTAATEGAMTAPGAYGTAARPQPAAKSRTLGTQFNARVG